MAGSRGRHLETAGRWAVCVLPMGRRSLPGRLSWQGEPLPAPQVGQGELFRCRCFGLRVRTMPPPSDPPEVPLCAMPTTLPKVEAAHMRAEPRHAGKQHGRDLGSK